MHSASPTPIRLTHCVELLARRDGLFRRYTALLVQLAELQAAYTELDLRVQHLAALTSVEGAAACVHALPPYQDPA